MIGDGLSGPEATDRLLKEWMPSSEKDPDAEAIFWLALAVTHWKCGRLEDRVKREAIRVIDDGSALRPWRGSPLVMHDGESVTLREAILRHRGEATQVSQRVEKLKKEDQEAIIEFLKSL